MKSNMFDFYHLGFMLGYLDESDLNTATYWHIITKEEFKEITDKEYEGTEFNGF